MQTTKINLNQILTSTEKKLHKDTKIIALLEKSIKEIGLLNPIIVNEKNELLSGYSRLIACENLGYSEISCSIVNTDKLRESLIQIDENLVRKQLSVFEEAKLLTEQKAIYELLHPTSRKSFKSKNNSLSEKERVETTESFSINMANKLECSPKNITNKVGQYESIISNSPSLENSISKLDKKTKVKGIELSKISKLTPSQMEELSKEIENNLHKKDFSLSKVLVEEKVIEKSMKEKLHQVFMYDLLQIATSQSISSLQNEITVNVEEAKKIKDELNADFTKEIDFLIKNIK